MDRGVGQGPRGNVRPWRCGRLPLPASRCAISRALLRSNESRLMANSGPCPGPPNMSTCQPQPSIGIRSIARHEPRHREPGQNQFQSRGGRKRQTGTRKIRQAIRNRKLAITLIQSPARAADHVKNAAEPVRRSQPIRVNRHSLRGVIGAQSYL